MVGNKFRQTGCFVILLIVFTLFNSYNKKQTNTRFILFVKTTFGGFIANKHVNLIIIYLLVERFFVMI